MPDNALLPGGSNSNGGFGDINSLMTMLQGLFGGGGTTTDGSSQSPEALQASMALFQKLLPELFSGDFSPDAATKDSQGQVDLILQRLREQGLPMIGQAENSSGGYNSTTTALMANDLTARAAGEGAARVAAVKSQYAGARSNQVKELIALITAMGNANRVSASKTTNNPTTTNAARNAALGAAALGALGKKPSGSGPKPKKPSDVESGNSNNSDTTGKDSANDDSNAGENYVPGGGAGSPYGEGEGSGDQVYTPADYPPSGGDTDPFAVQGEVGGLNDLADFNFGDMDFSFLNPIPDAGGQDPFGDFGDLGGGTTDNTPDDGGGSGDGPDLNPDDPSGDIFGDGGDEEPF